MSKTKQITILFLLLPFTTLFAQNDILIPNRVGSKWGFKTMEGNVQVEAIYDSVSHFTHYIETKKAVQLAKVKKDDSWGLVNIAGTLVIPTEYEQLNEAKVYRNPNYYIAKNKKGKFAILHQEQFLTEFEYDTLSYQYDYITAQKGSKIGILELSGKVKIPIAYHQIILLEKFEKPSYLEEGWEISGGELVFAQANIHVKLPATFQPDEPFCVWSVSDATETKYIITDEFYGLHTTKLSKLKKEMYNEVEIISGTLGSDEDTSKYEKRYERLSDKGYNFKLRYYSDERFYKFTKDDGYLLGVYDLEKNKEIISPVYTSIRMPEYNSKDYFLVNDNRKYGLFDTNGTEIFPAIYDNYDNQKNVFIFKKEKFATFFSLKTKKKSSGDYEFLDTIAYYEYKENQQTLIRVKKYGVVFYLDTQMNEYYTK